MTKVACIGNLTYDILAYTKNFPKENTRCDYNKIINSTGGPASNAAFLLDKYNIEVDLYSVIGTDMFSKLALEELKKSNINLENLIIKDNMKIPLSYIIVSENKKTRTINAYRDSQDNKNISFQNYKNDYDIILTDGKYVKATLELIKNNKNATTIIDAGRCNEDIIDLCSYINYIICSEDFANELAKTNGEDYKIDINNPKETKIVMNILKKKYNNSFIATTIGKDGYLYFNNESLIHRPAKKIGKVIDTTAAGDIFHGAFTYAMANDKNFEDSLDFANTVSSLSVTKNGGKNSIPDLNEIECAKKLIYKK